MVSLRGAAWSALCYLWLGCGDGIRGKADLAKPAVLAPLIGAQADPTADAPLPKPDPDEAGDAGEAAADPDAPTTTLDAPLEAWPIAFASDELAVIDDALFAGDALYVAGRAGERVVVQRLTRVADKGAAKVGAKGAADKLAHAVEGGPASPVVLVPLGKGVAALWIADGHLDGVAVDATTDMTAVTPAHRSGEEGGQLAGPLVAAAGEDGVVACADDKLGPLCFELDAQLGLASAHPIAKKMGSGDPRALIAVAHGFMLVLGDCKGQTCARVDLTAVELDARGEPGKRRDLPLVQLDRGTAFIPNGDGFVLVARRVGAGEHSAWAIGETATRELDGRFSRVVGGFAHDERTLLIERAHLRMRKGFPVRGYQVRPLGDDDDRTGANANGTAHAKKRKQDVEREAIPDAITDLLPTDADQRFSANRDALLFAAPLRKGRLEAVAVRLLAKR